MYFHYSCVFVYRIINDANQVGYTIIVVTSVFRHLWHVYCVACLKFCTCIAEADWHLQMSMIGIYVPRGCGTLHFLPSITIQFWRRRRTLPHLQLSVDMSTRDQRKKWLWFVNNEHLGAFTSTGNPFIHCIHSHLHPLMTRVLKMLTAS